MPIYEYRCQKCGHYLDVLQKVNDDRLVDCPECETASLKRLMSAPSFRLKGGGWYETDFKSDKEKRRNLADRPEAANGSAQAGSGASGGDAKAGDKGGDKSSDKAGDKAAAKPAESGGAKSAKPEAAA